MCIVCRGRFLKSQLIRLQYKEKKLIKFSGIGRSFYVCGNCIDEKRAVDCIIKTCKIDKQLKEILKNSLKEIFVYG